MISRFRTPLRRNLVRIAAILVAAACLDGCSSSSGEGDSAESNDAPRYTWSTADGVIGEIACLTIRE